MSIQAELVGAGIILGSALLYMGGSKIVVKRCSDEELRQKYYKMKDLAEKDHRILRVFPFRVSFNQIIDEIKRRGLNG
jgi:hypothetical protein